jgi:hypothetical protein
MCNVCLCQKFVLVWHPVSLAGGFQLPLAQQFPGDVVFVNHKGTIELSENKGFVDLTICFYYRKFY